MRVTLDVFSGRANPNWQVPPTVARHVADLVTRQGGPSTFSPARVLGFRGLVVQADLDDVAWPQGLPPSFTLSAPRAGISTATLKLGAARPAPTHEAEAALAILGTAHPSIAGEVIKEARRQVEGGGAAAGSTETPAPNGEDAGGGKSARKSQAKGTAAAREVAAAEPEMGPLCEPLLSDYRPWFWNAPSVRLRNNCYNYASNCVSNAVAQPGRFSGEIYRAFTKEEVTRAALADGYTEECRGLERVVALAIWPGQDFHWYRKHADFWAHKLGIFSARNVDNRGRVIGGELSPASCDRGPYVQFGGFLFVPPGVRVF